LQRKKRNARDMRQKKLRREDRKMRPNRRDKDKRLRLLLRQKGRGALLKRLLSWRDRG
jgi:hypothetical protein